MPESGPSRTETISQEDRLLPPAWVRRSLGDNRARSGSSNVILEGLPGKSPLKQGLVETVSNSKELLLLSSFLYADPVVEGAVLDAARRGVRVYLLTASENRLRTEMRMDGEVDTRKFDEHSRLLNGLAGKVLVRTGEDLHAKFALADPFSRGALGVLSTANFTTDALGGHQELGVRLEASEARDLARLFLHGFWSQSQHELLVPGRLHEVQGLPPGPRPVSLPFTAKGVTRLRETLEGAIRDSQGPLLLSSFGFDRDHSSVRLLVDSARAGREVRVLTRRRDNPLQVDAVMALASAGGTVRSFDNLHAKALVWKEAGRPIAAVMTANFAKLGLDQGFEAGVVLEGTRAEGVQSVLESWWDSAPWEFHVGLKRKEIVGELQLWERGHLLPARVGADSPIVNLGTVEAESEAAAALARPARFPEPEGEKGLTTLYHRNRYVWDVVVRSGNREKKTQGSRRG